MSRLALLSILAWLLLAPRMLQAFDDGPPISIVSPDAAVTFAYGSIKSHSLIWDKRNKLLIARVVFTDAELNQSLPQDDMHDFRLPGVSFDETKGIFYAVSARGEVIPVARIKKALFLKTIEVLPNAHVRVEYPRGNVTVTLEAISPNDPAMHAPPPETNPDGTHAVDLRSILQ